MIRLPDSALALLDDALRGSIDAGLAPGVVAAVTDRDGALYRGAFGLAGTASREPLRTDYVFRIASLTKLVTTIAVLMLVEQGRVALDAPFKRYLAGFRQPPVLRSFDRETLSFDAAPAARDITIRDLLTHTSGYGSWFLNDEIRALTGAVPEFYDPPFLMSEPGARFQYSISTDVLGQLFAPVTGRALADFFAAHIFSPLGMRDTSYDPPSDPGRLVHLHTAAAGAFEQVPHERRSNAPRGGAGLYSTADDYLALLRLLLNGGVASGHRLLSAETVAALARNQVGSLPVLRQRSALPALSDDFLFMDGTQRFGFGVLIETRARDSGRSAGSYGWGGLYNTYFWVDPAAGLGAIVMMQVSPFCRPACIEVCERFERAVFTARDA
jgi:CubicO group peptidase (beta-lactamase class C family)